MSQETQTGTQEVPFEHREALLCCAGDRALVQVAQKGFGASFLGDTQKPPEHGLGQLTVGVPAGAGLGPDGFRPQALSDDETRTCLILK